MTATVLPSRLTSIAVHPKAVTIMDEDTGELVVIRRSDLLDLVLILVRALAGTEEGT